MVLLGLLLALASAFTTNVGFLLRHRGAVAAPYVTVRHPVRSVIGLFRWSDRALMACIGVVCLALAALLPLLPM